MHISELLKKVDGPPDKRFVPIMIEDNVRESKARNEREDIIEDIRSRLNKGREGTKYRQLSFLAVNLKVKHLDDWDLKFLFDKCKKAKSFGGCFWGELQVKK